MKFLKVCLLLAVYIVLWGVNSFSFAQPQVEQVRSPAQQINSHVIPLIRINGELRRVEELSFSTDSIFQ